ncbi:MAG: hypothetical protein ACFE9Q_07945 [Candidatus Hodarchaeota archaeon]
MDEFLRKMQLSEYALEIYLKSLGKLPLSFYELYSIVPKATLEEFNNSLNELLDSGLLVQHKSKNQENIIHYTPLAPILPILNYYNNIETNLPNIKNSIYELLAKSISNAFQENKDIELDTILNVFQGIKKDIDEDSIIQKQEIEDIVEGMEELKKINKIVSDLHKNIKSITQTKFADLIKTINSLKKDLLENIKKKEILLLIEQNFKDKFDNMVGDFTNNLHELIEKEFNEIYKPIEKTSDSIFQYRNDFKMLLLTMLTNFESKMNAIYEVLKENQENLLPAMKNLQNKITENLSAIIQNSLNEVSNLNKPIENVMKNYFQKIRTIDQEMFDKIWMINSVTKINEIIQNLIVNSKENLSIIIPHLENHLALEQFDKIADNLKIKITSSEAHTNSIVKSFKDIKKIIYRTYQNEELIVLKGDNDFFVMGVIQDSKDPLNDFIGFSTMFKPLIKLLDVIIKNIWETAYPDSFHATQVTKVQASMATPTKSLTSIKPIIPRKIQSQNVIKKPSQIETKKIKPSITMPDQIQEIEKSDKRYTISSSTPTPVPSSTAPGITDLKRKLQEKITFVTAAQPQVGDKVGIEINTAFNILIDKLGNIKGDEFGKELQNIADLILEKKGFSVTLHKVRSTIEKYKEKLALLDEKDKKEIMEEIESWKKKLF